MQSQSFDVVLNILVGIKRSLSNLVEVPNTPLDDWQFEKILITESDWLASSSKG